MNPCFLTWKLASTASLFQETVKFRKNTMVLIPVLFQGRQEHCLILKQTDSEGEILRSSRGNFPQEAQVIAALLVGGVTVDDKNDHKSRSWYWYKFYILKATYYRVQHFECQSIQWTGFLFQKNFFFKKWKWNFYSKVRWNCSCFHVDHFQYPIICIKVYAQHPLACTFVCDVWCLTLTLMTIILQILLFFC